jgi:hypothetical protein
MRLRHSKPPCHKLCLVAAKNSGEIVAWSIGPLLSPLTGHRVVSGDLRRPRLSRKNLIERPLYPLGRVLNHLDLFGVFRIPRKGDRLQGVAHVVVHSGDYPDSSEEGSILSLLIGERKKARQYSYDQIIHINNPAMYLECFQEVLHQSTQKKKAKSQEEAQPDPAKEGRQLRISVHDSFLPIE